MNQDNKLLLKLKINLKNTYEIKAKDKTIVQILFDGDASGDYFKGTILPGAVDTQTIYPDGTGELSARYTIDGIDREGQKCKLYISNVAKMGDNKTTPKITTNSQALSFFNNAAMYGEIVWVDNQMYINIYEIIY